MDGQEYLHSASGSMRGIEVAPSSFFEILLGATVAVETVAVEQVTLQL